MMWTGNLMISAMPSPKSAPKPKVSADWLQLHKVRRCYSVHECCFCDQNIVSGQRYYDGGHGKRAHVSCANANSVEGKRLLDNVKTATINYKVSAGTATPEEQLLHSYQKLVGKTITKVRMDPDSGEEWPILVCDDGTQIHIWRDPEGNGPGHMRLFDHRNNPIR